MTDGIASVDLAVVGRDTLWVVDLMNTLVVRSDGAYVREFTTLLDAADDLTPGYPAVVLVAPLSPDDSLDAFAPLMAARPELAFVFTIDEAAGDDAVVSAEQLEALSGTAPIASTDVDAIVPAVLDALRDVRLARGAFDPTAITTADEVVEDALVIGPSASMRIIAVTSGKGGTGTTTFAINLAAAIVEQGARATLVDAHGATGDVGFLLAVESPERMALDRVDIDAASIPHYTSVHASDVRAVILPTDEDQLHSLTPRQLLEVLVALAEHTDVVVVDLPLALLAASNITSFASNVLIVTTTHLASLKNTRIAADVIGRGPELGLVRNDVTADHVDHGRAAIEGWTQVALLAELPYDDAIIEGAGADPVSALSGAKSKYTKHLRELAEHLLAQPSRAGTTHEDDSDDSDPRGSDDDAGSDSDDDAGSRRR